MIKSIWPASMTIKYFRSFKDINFTLGKKITLISGQNGVGKSNLLSLIASASGLNKSSYLGNNFQPDFNEFFSIDQSEDFTKYSLYVDFNDQSGKHVLRKKLTFKDDSKTNRGIRIIPRTAKLPGDESKKLQEVQKNVKERYGVGGAARVNIPTIYLSISRLYPLGEKKDLITIKEYKRSNSLYQKNANVAFAKWYNSVIPNCIESESQLSLIDKKKLSKRSSYHMAMHHTPALSQSIGQDNLGNIISALVDIYILSQESDYQGALVCIDEIDVSLHPDTQIRLLELMDSLADELSIQFVFTTHSLTFLKELSKKREKSSDDYSIVYLKNPSMPIIHHSNDYYSIKADLFNEMIYNPPKPKVYFEDEVGEKMFHMMVEAIEEQIDSVKKNGYLRNITDKSEEINHQLMKLEPIVGIEKKVKLIPVELGCEELIRLSSIDPYFKRVIMMLDGDARIKGNKNIQKPAVCDYLDRQYTDRSHDRQHDPNICFLPGYFAPESYLYKIIYQLVNNQKTEYEFWRSLDAYEETSLYTADKIGEIIHELQGGFDNDSVKNLFNKKGLWKFVDSTSILKYYYGSYKTVSPLIEFGNDLLKAYKMTLSLTRQNKYS